MKSTMSLNCIVVFMAIISFPMFSQNNYVGINNSSPQEELDVNGNINLTGVLKVNGVSPQSGQILKANASGAIGWVDLNEFDHVIEFIYHFSSNSWTVPTGVTEIAFEIWGAGGAGNAGGGGGSGAYACGTMAVTPGNTLTIDIGNAGSLSNSSPGESKITYGTNYVRAYGGYNASSTAPGTGGTYGTKNTSQIDAVFYPGENGEPTKISYGQETSTNYMRIYEYGDGGSSRFHPSSGGEGGVRVYNIGTSALAHYYLYRSGTYPGGGGGGYYTMTVGGIGKVIIYY